LYIEFMFFDTFGVDVMHLEMIKHVGASCFHTLRLLHHRLQISTITETKCAGQVYFLS
jgi:hypothetical protein